MRRLRILLLGEINISRYRSYFLHGNDTSCLDSSFREQEDSFAKLGEGVLDTVCYMQHCWLCH